MSAYGGLLNFLNKLGKRDKMLGFHNELNKFNNTKARMLDSIYHMTLKSFLIHIFWVTLKRHFITFPENL